MTKKSLTKSSRGATATGATAIGAASFGAMALGAVALGAAVVGALAIGRLSVGRARLRRVEIDELIVGRIEFRADGASGPAAVARIAAAPGKGDALERFLRHHRAGSEPGAPPFRAHRSRSDPDMFLFLDPTPTRLRLIDMRKRWCSMPFYGWRPRPSFWRPPRGTGSRWRFIMRSDTRPDAAKAVRGPLAARGR